MTKLLGRHYMERYRKRGVPLSPATLYPSELAKTAHTPNGEAGLSLTKEQLGNLPTEVLRGLWSSYQQLSALDSERYSSAVSQGIQADEQDCQHPQEAQPCEAAEKDDLQVEAVSLPSSQPTDAGLRLQESRDSTSLANAFKFLSTLSPLAQSPIFPPAHSLLHPVPPLHQPQNVRVDVPQIISDLLGDVHQPNGAAAKRSCRRGNQTCGSSPRNMTTLGNPFRGSRRLRQGARR